MSSKSGEQEMTQDIEKKFEIYERELKDRKALRSVWNYWKPAVKWLFKIGLGCVCIAIFWSSLLWLAIYYAKFMGWL